MAGNNIMENLKTRHAPQPKEQMLVALDFLCEKSSKLGMLSTSVAIKKAMEVALSETK